jgi:iron complex outermembrane receptor protein
MKNISGSAGLLYIHQGNTVNGTVLPFIPNFKSDAIGFFLLEKWTREKLEVEAGARYDFKWMKSYMYNGNDLISPERSFRNFTGSLGAVYRLSDKLQLKGNFGTAFRPPSAAELYSNGLHHGAARIERGDSTLVPEYAFNTSFSARYTGSHLRAEVYIYNNYIRNYIYLKPSLTKDAFGNYSPLYLLSIRGAFPVWNYSPVNASFTGIDFQINDSLSPHWVAGIKGSLLRAFNETAGQHLILTPPANFEYGLRYKFRDKGKFQNLYLELKQSLVLRKYKAPANQDILPPPPAYTLVSIEAGSDIFIGRQTVVVTFSIYNLFNTRYRNYLDQFRYFTLEPGRGFAIRLKIPFEITNKNIK